MAFPYPSKEAYELSGTPQELSKARLQELQAAGKYIGDGTCMICAHEYFVDPVRPVLLHHDGSETLHMICEDCYSKQYDNDKQTDSECPYCRLKLFMLPGEDADDEDDVIRLPTPEDLIRLTRFRIEQIQRGDLHENSNLFHDQILMSDLRWLGRLHNQHGDLWWRNPLHAVDEQALRTVLTHRAAVYMADELDSSLAIYDAAYGRGDDEPRVRPLDNYTLNGSNALEYSLDVDEISTVLRDGFYRRFLQANVNGTRGMVTHPLAMQALLVIETTLRNERERREYHRPSSLYKSLSTALRTRDMGKVQLDDCEEDDCDCEESNESQVCGLETVIADMVTTVINLLRSSAARMPPVPVDAARRSASQSRRESKIRWRRNYQVSPPW